MRQWYELTVPAVIGDDEQDEEETILNRTLKIADGGLEYAVGPRREQQIRAKYRGIAARANYLSQDRVDLQFATKEACRQMSARPSGQVWTIRVARYLLKHPKLVRKYDRGEWSENDIDVLSDSQWAAFARSRRSTSGCVIVVDGRTVKHWSSTQATIAMPLGEAEYYVMVKAGAEVPALVALSQDVGYEFQLRFWVDSSGAKAIVTRLGLRKVRHMEVKFLRAPRTALFEIVRSS